MDDEMRVGIVSIHSSLIITLTDTFYVLQATEENSPLLQNVDNSINNSSGSTKSAISFLDALSIPVIVMKVMFEINQTNILF